MTDIALPCPFCGSDSIAVSPIRDGYRCTCRKCGGAGPCEFHGPPHIPAAHVRSVTSWNKRSNQAPTEACPSPAAPATECGLADDEIERIVEEGTDAGDAAVAFQSTPNPYPAGSEQAEVWSHAYRSAYARSISR